MTRAIPGVLIECDPSIRAIILKIDADKNEYIIEELDENTLLVKESKLADLKARLEQILKDTQEMPEEEDSS